MEIVQKLASSTPLFFFISSIFLILPITPFVDAQQSDFLFHFCLDNQGNYTNNSTYQTSLHTLLSSLTTENNTYTGFYRSTDGEVYATGLCRGDVKQEDCRSCLNNAAQLLTKLCPNQKEAILWYRKCSLRYSSRYIFGIIETDPAFYMTSKKNVSANVTEFHLELRALLENLRVSAVGGDTSRKFAAGNTNSANHFNNLYALVQCLPDLSSSDCNDCIVVGVEVIDKYCYGNIRAYAGLPSCNVAYDLKLFYDSSADVMIQLPPPPPQISLSSPSETVNSSLPSTEPTGTGTGKKNNISRMVPIIALPSVVFFMLLLLCIFLYLRIRKAKVKVETEEENSNSTDFLKFDFGIIREATNDFSDANKLGQGGFGAVYMGWLSTGKEIAVKRLIKHSGPSRQGDLEFQNEVLLVAKLQHRNLVNLLGFCLEKMEKILIYEYAPNSSLDRFIFDPINCKHLDWNRRYKIIRGIARGLLYLHEGSRLKIIHRDLKASNILLDEKMNPKIADFGTARLFALDQIEEKTKKIVGTYGYMAPEYARFGEFSVKSDVFSFGILVLEIVSGQKVNNFHDGEKLQSLPSYAWENWRKGKAMNLVDSKMSWAASRHEISRCIHIGLLCVQEKIADRPTMGSVVVMLSSYSLALQSPSQPAHFIQLERKASATDDSNTHENSSAPVSKNDASITELYPR